MAVLDPRLLPLLETLAASGADWLAFEIVDGVRRGREPEEPEELLQAARENVRSRQPERIPSPELSKLAEPILGDDQIAWAADYVLARLDGALADLNAGYAMIESIADDSSGRSEKAGPSPVEADCIKPVTVVVLGEEDLPIDRRSIAAARNGIPGLRAALAAWSLQSRGRPVP